MLKSAIYCNVFILLIMSIFFLTRIFMKNSDFVVDLINYQNTDLLACL